MPTDASLCISIAFVSSCLRFWKFLRETHFRCGFVGQTVVTGRELAVQKILKHKRLSVSFLVK